MAVVERYGEQKVSFRLRAAWTVWWIMIAVEPSECGLKMRKSGEGLKVVLRSWRRAILIFLRRMSALKFCWE